jgi:BED zinc finger
MSKPSSTGTAASNDMITDAVQVSDESDAGEQENNVDDGTSPIPSSNPSGGRSSQGEKKVRKRKSEVWKIFKLCKLAEGEQEVNRRVECKFCEQKYKYVPGGTTSTMQRHIKGCGRIKRAKGKISGLIPICESSEHGENEIISKGWGKYCQFKSRELLSKMITVHELPFMFAEYQWFNAFMKYNNPMYQKVSRNTIKKECVKVFETEKDKLKKVFKNIDRISLTYNCWTSNQTISYMCLTAHYIDLE